jgi:CPA2 family monovalent cation:H+ antiporter-2
VGKTLAELNLRGLTGATVLAIIRKAGNIPYPTAKEVLRAGDLLALTGTQEAIEAAKQLLCQNNPDPAKFRKGEEA